MKRLSEILNFSADILASVTHRLDGGGSVYAACVCTSCGGNESVDVKLDGWNEWRSAGEAETVFWGRPGCGFRKVSRESQQCNESAESSPKRNDRTRIALVTHRRAWRVCRLCMTFRGNDEYCTNKPNHLSSVHFQKKALSCGEVELATDFNSSGRYGWWRCQLLVVDKSLNNRRLYLSIALVFENRRCSPSSNRSFQTEPTTDTGTTLSQKMAPEVGCHLQAEVDPWWVSGACCFHQKEL